jgi:uncharacterized protein YgiM (DUF1202 family)
MKKTYRKVFILTIAICSFAFNFTGESTSAQTRSSAKSTPTPKSKKTTTSDRTPKSSNAANTKKTAAIQQIIVTGTAVNIRELPTAKSNRLTQVKLGKILPVTEKKPAFYRVEYAEGKSGWISITFTRDFESSKRETLYRQIADKYTKNKTLDFAEAAEVVDFLKTAQNSAKSDEERADFSFQRLRVLDAALKKIPFDKGGQNPYKAFLDANEKEVVYSEPSGQWLVRAEVLWELQSKYVALPIAEEIAWTAANTSIPGECEGYINCNLYQLRATSGEYLNFYPNGKYSKKALNDITNTLEISVADMNNKQLYTPLSDISERAEFNRFLTELRTIISKLSDIDKAKPLRLINQLGEGYK